MRPILGFVLVLGACGDNVMLDGEGGTEGFEDAVDVDGVASEDDERPARLQPQLCGERAWGSMELANRDHDLAIATTKNGAALFTTPLAGGAIRGLALDGRGFASEDSGALIRDDQKFTSVAAAFVDERLVLASVSGDRVHFDMIDHDLTQRFELGAVDGTLIAPVAAARGNTRIATVAGQKGIHTVLFDGKWKLTGTERISDVEPFSLTATQYYDDALVAWSTADSCHVRRIGAGIESSRGFPCVGAKLAMDDHYDGILVYEADGNVMISDVRIGGESELADRRLLAPDGTSPRVVHDGTRFWISYVDQRSDVVVGFLDGTKFVSMSLAGLTPENRTHELALVDYRPWLFDLGAQGIAARGLCAVVNP